MRSFALQGKPGNRPRLGADLGPLELTPESVCDAEFRELVTRHRVQVELVPLLVGEFRRWVRLCRGAGRFGWSEVGASAPYSG